MGTQDGNDDNQHSNDESQQHDAQANRGTSGEGAASAMQHMITQVDRKRHQCGDADGTRGHAQ